MPGKLDYLINADAYPAYSIQILQGIRKGKGYREIATDMGKSLGMVQFFAAQLQEGGMIDVSPSWRRGQKNRMILTEKGELLCKKQGLKKNN